MTHSSEFTSALSALFIIKMKTTFCFHCQPVTPKVACNGAFCALRFKGEWIYSYYAWYSAFLSCLNITSVLVLGNVKTSWFTMLISIHFICQCQASALALCATKFSCQSSYGSLPWGFYFQVSLHVHTFMDVFPLHAYAVMCLVHLVNHR